MDKSEKKTRTPWRVFVVIVTFLVMLSLTRSFSGCGDIAPVGEMPGGVVEDGDGLFPDGGASLPPDDGMKPPQLEEFPTGDPGPYTPLKYAMETTEVLTNAEATVPSQCYTKTDGISNPCWSCHTVGTMPNHMQDWQLQISYAFSEVALTNHWENLFKDRSARIAEISDAQILYYIREDNYSQLRQSIAAMSPEEYPGYRPDLDFDAGFDEEGFAVDGSHWRAIRYKPFLGTFWPTNGSTDDVFIRLPAVFRTDAGGNESREIYKINLAILEAVIAGNPTTNPEDAERRVEPVSEKIAGFDLDGDGTLSDSIEMVRGTPTHFAGAAADIKVRRYLYPEGAEFLHSVRYVDPDKPGMIATRMKELRYSRKFETLDNWALIWRYEQELNEKEEGKLPVYPGGPEVGLRNPFGWQLQGFIEDEHGRLRLQTREEHLNCMGCHSSVGVTVDQTFTLARKVPGEEGWRYQDIRGMKDAPQYNHEEPEIFTYMKRVRGGDEFRANGEMIARFFDDSGQIRGEEVLRASRSGDKDIAWLLAPSRERALLLNKAYRALVEEQTFHLGRDTIISPPQNVHRFIVNGDTELASTEQVYKDGSLFLDWDR